MKKIARILLMLCFVVTAGVSVYAGPQHWGSGYPYLAVLEDTDAGTQLKVYEGPLRAKDAEWIVRWTDTSDNYRGALPGGIAIGNFYPKDFGTELLAVLYPAGKSTKLKVFRAPEQFSIEPWTCVQETQLPLTGVLALTAGDPAKAGRDSLLALTKKELVIIEPPATESGNDWKISRRVALPEKGKGITGFACGQFWKGTNDFIALARAGRGGSEITYYSLNAAGLTLVKRDTAKGVPAALPTTFVCADYTKDGFDTLTFLTGDTQDELELRVAPLGPGMTKKDLGPLYTGKAMSRQWLPGTDGEASKEVMKGTRQAVEGKVRAAAAGRVFGYIATDLTSAVRNQHSYNPAPDAEIAFTHRIPTNSTFRGAPKYGWPEKGEQAGYEINIKNNGQKTIAGNGVLKVWLNTPYRNADTLPETSGKPDYVIQLTKDLPAFNPLKPEYQVYTVLTNWPYSLIPCGPRATWKKVNLDEVGELWVVVSMEYPEDTNKRNNRYSAALHSYTYHPIFAEPANLANRIPTVEGDPCSLEYLSRKMADGIQCVWERSGTVKNEDVLQRSYFDGYKIGFPDHEKDNDKRLKAWRDVQDRYEGWREIDIWWGENQTWEKFDWTYAAELHESGHLFHPIGDLYGLFAYPAWTGAAKMADGKPVQLMTQAWGPDLFAIGEAVISLPACELMERYIVGSRGVGLERWWTVCPKKLFVRILDRDGNPVPGATVTAWSYMNSEPAYTGKTGPDGRLDLAEELGEPTYDNMGRAHFYHTPENRLTDALTQIFTVEIDGYQDSAILGAETEAAHGRHTLLLHSMTDEEEWTWDFKTNYKKGAPKPGFTAEASIKGSVVQMGVTGDDGAHYRLYRRWQPSYARTFIGEYVSTGSILKITQDMSEPDSREGNRFRAIYEITEMTKAGESLPRTITATGFKKARGVSTDTDEALLLTVNSGLANPICVKVDGQTFIEYFYHYRFGHTAIKAVPSVKTPGRYYMTISAADMGTSSDYRFDIVDPLSKDRTGYDIRITIGYFNAKVTTGDGPYRYTMADAAKARLINMGDELEIGTVVVTITNKVGTTLITDGPLCAADRKDVGFTALRFAGQPGNNLEMRDLSNPHGLTVISDGTDEYIVIADTDNNRVVVWDDTTAYKTHWTKPMSTFTAVATHPLHKNSFFAIDRANDSYAMVYLVEYKDGRLQVQPGSELKIPTGPNAGGQIGLAVVAASDGTGIYLAATDAANNRVLEYKRTGNTWTPAGEYTKATGTYAGAAALDSPTDVTYSRQGGKLTLYVVDGTDRMVQLR